jgi:hypothetical protein
MFLPIRRLAFTATLGVLISGAAMAVEEEKLPMSEPVKLKDLTITVQPVKKEFGPKDALTLQVVFRNDSKEGKQVFMTEYLGTQTLGRYTYTFKDLATGQTWQIGQDPNAILPGAPAQLAIRQIPAGEALTTRVLLPGAGMRFWQGGTEKAPQKTTSSLPPGKYEVVITMLLNEGKVQTKPVAFTIAGN